MNEQMLSGNAGNDEINGGNDIDGNQLIHGDTWDSHADYLVEYTLEDTGNDRLTGGNDIIGIQKKWWLR